MNFLSNFSKFFESNNEQYEVIHSFFISEEVNIEKTELKYIKKALPNYHIGKKRTKYNKSILFSFKQNSGYASFVKSNILITKIEDEYFIVIFEKITENEYEINTDFYGVYKCDQIWGLIKCIEDRKKYNYF